MAQPLNTFRTTTVELNSGPFIGDSDVVYVTPAGITAIVLMAQVANVDSDEHTVTFSHFDRENQLNTELVKDLPVLPNDAAGLVSGKLIVEETNRIRASASESGKVKLTLSYLESLNG